jgi:hypothetical protein
MHLQVHATGSSAHPPREQLEQSHELQGVSVIARRCSGQWYVHAEPSDQVAPFMCRSIAAPCCISGLHDDCTLQKCNLSVTISLLLLAVMPGTSLCAGEPAVALPGRCGTPCGVAVVVQARVGDDAVLAQLIQ